MRLLLFRTATLVAHEMARDKVVYVVVQWIVPLQLVHWDDVIDCGRERIGPLEREVDELSALVAYLAGPEYSCLSLLETNSLAP